MLNCASVVDEANIDCISSVFNSGSNFCNRGNTVSSYLVSEGLRSLGCSKTSPTIRICLKFYLNIQAFHAQSNSGSRGVGFMHLWMSGVGV